MPVDVKVCGLMRPEDAAAAARAGAHYIGVVFAESRRQVQPTRARQVLDGAGNGAVRRVGVFAAMGVEAILDAARVSRLDVLQLHDLALAASLPALRTTFDGEIWGVIRIGGGTRDRDAWEAWSGADAIVLDAYSPVALGGTGRSFDWTGTASALSQVRGTRRVVLAGGLTPANVGAGILALSPTIVDVSSGVERTVGEKDSGLIDAFVRAVARTHT